MDSIYKKVKNKTASPFEEDALSKYYMITHLKETQYLEYKYRKQKYLLELDYANLKEAGKEKALHKYYPFYIEKMDTLYKGILKNYSVQLADNLRTSANDKDEIYDKVFDTVEEYIINILNLKMKLEEYEIEKETLEQYDKYAKFLAGKPDSIDLLEKKMIILVHTTNARKAKKAYKMLLNIIEEYNVNLLSTKIYWEKPKEREEYKKFWEAFKKIDILDEKEKAIQKEILFLRNDLSKISKEPKRYKLVINSYKNKLVELGAMRELKNTCRTKSGRWAKKKKGRKRTK